jgi:hypothetical protein
MDIYAQMAAKIIKEQESIIGPIALEQARKVTGLNVDWQKQEVNIAGDESAILEKLVEQYQHLFGQTSVEVCKDAVKSLKSEIPPDKMPPLLR